MWFWLPFFVLLIDVNEWIDNECAECVLPHPNIHDWFTWSHRSKGENRTRNCSEIARVNGPYNFYTPFLFLHVVNDFDLEGFPKRSSVCGSLFEVRFHSFQFPSRVYVRRLSIYTVRMPWWIVLYFFRNGWNCTSTVCFLCRDKLQTINASFVVSKR